MGLGSTAKKLQKVADIADELYTKVNEQKQQLQALRDTVEETNDHVSDIDDELAQQRALLEALADQQGLDTDAILTEAVIEDAETTAPASGTGATDAEATPADGTDAERTD